MAPKKTPRQMTLNQKIAKVRRLRKQGLTFREIGERMGIHKEAAWRYCNYEKWLEWERARNDKKRAWEDANRAPCPKCGTPMGGGSVGKAHRPTMCRECEFDARHEGRRVRWDKIERMWHSGASLRQIAEAMDTTVNGIGTDMAHMRAAGRDLPYRYPGNQRKYAQAA